MDVLPRQWVAVLSLATYNESGSGLEKEALNTTFQWGLYLKKKILCIYFSERGRETLKCERNVDRLPLMWPQLELTRALNWK